MKKGHGSNPYYMKNFGVSSAKFAWISKSFHEDN